LHWQTRDILCTYISPIHYGLTDGLLLDTNFDRHQVFDLNWDSDFAEIHHCLGSNRGLTTCVSNAVVLYSLTCLGMHEVLGRAWL